MRIVVNTGISVTDDIFDFVYEMLMVMARQQPQHQFILLAPSLNNKPLPENFTVEVISKPLLSIASLLWWYNAKLPKILKKHKAGVLIDVPGMCSLFTTIPQVLLVRDNGILFYSGLFSKYARFFLKLCTPLFFRKAAVITTVSEFFKRTITSDYNIPSSKIINISHAALPVFKPISWDERESIKEQYAGAAEYFVYVNSIYSQGHLINLLKAFSTFKKRQLTNMKLLITGNFAAGYNNIFEKLKTYKFQNDVEIACNLPLPEYAKVIAAAYALVYPGGNEGFCLPVAEAMKCDVPVIASKGGCMDETGGEAVLYIDPQNIIDIAEQMKLIFKDENLRTHFIKKGRLQAANFSLEKSAALMWQAIQLATSK